MQLETMFITRDGPIATLHLNRTTRLNAFGNQGTIDLNIAADALARDDTARIVIITGEGRAFSTGIDLKELSAGEIDMSYHHRWEGGLRKFEAMNKVVIGAINGYCLGGGLQLALACDIRIASTNAQFGQSEVCIGSIPAAGGTQRLPRMIGMSDAMLMMLTGNRINAEEALRIGLVSRLVPASELMNVAREIATRIADNAPLAVRAVKRLVKDGMDMPLLTAIQAEQFALGLLRDSEDRIEGRRAFQEKRKPNYQGR